MTRLFFPKSQDHPTQLPLTKDQHHYLTHVLRLKPNTTIDLVIQDTALRNIQVTQITPKTLHYTTRTETPITKKALTITLAQALPKQDKFSEIIKKCTELDIDHIIPIHSQHSIPKPKDTQHLRWQRILDSASAQSKRLTLPTLHPITSLKTLDITPYDLAIVCWEGEHSTTLKALLTQHPSPQNILIIIGPEGGLSEAEIAHLKTQNCHSVTIADTILRVENAAFLTLANILYEYTQ